MNDIVPKVFIIIFSFFNNLLFSQDNKTPILVTNPGEDIELVGELGIKLGNTVEVEGIIIEGPYKGYEGGPNLMIQTIDSSAIQIAIHIPLRPYMGEFGEGSIPELQTSNTYRLRVYETGEFVGIPADAYKEANIAIQTSGFYFRNELVVISGKEIKRIEHTPSDFIEREALLSGIAKNDKNGAYIKGSQWKIILKGTRKWSEMELNKEVEVYGKIMQSENKHVFYVENDKPRLVRLEDQENQTVRIRGTAVSMNDQWWFNYRGKEIFVEKMNEMPNWSASNHFQAMEISGTLKRIDSKGIDLTEINSHNYCNGQYIIVNPSWIPIEGLLSPELSEGQTKQKLR